eukprot:scaffold2004_cov420-Prasinococcus_capsulatus_cf.AAC.11
MQPVSLEICFGLDTFLAPSLLVSGLACVPNLTMTLCSDANSRSGPMMTCSSRSSRSSAPETRKVRAFGAPCC